MRTHPRTFFRPAVQTSALLATTALVLALAGCGAEATPPEPARPVLVTRPGGGAEAALAAYAGEIRAREESPLSFRVGGKLLRREVDVGAHVRQGDLLAVLDAGDLSAQARAVQAQLAAAQAELARASGDQARYAKLAAQQLVSRSVLDAQNAAVAAARGQVNAARANLDVARNQTAYTQLRAPRDGMIATRSAEAGQVVGAGQPVFSIAADGGREVAIALPESRIREFTVGQPVLVELWSAPDRHLPGTIREISPAADPQARTYAARVSLVGAAAEAVDLGQSARVYVQDNGQRAALTVPLSALQRSPTGEAAVWVVDPATQTLHLAPVRLGAFRQTTAPLLSGVAPDAWIVAAGGHLLREGQKVSPVDRQNRPIEKMPGNPVAANAP
ncbi:efflux RND transporter periplasmic adaptor subunit [Agrilutibacter solisilvae]|uniref:Efflux RND transporter periplasmic adaptor subunit n=1 Tax=Agrilutibacter solisilvae TaxID=2763317 RepID=A0A975ATN4_9GAMM|nr:efflux RND transporter periplasmic adaptor subunit [Lysobacter solisilvae]QSX79493.1 efflux RND transporter periplasmic adaptor subunit [Lysobacter solisilvae]